MTPLFAEMIDTFPAFPLLSPHSSAWSVNDLHLFILLLLSYRFGLEQRDVELRYLFSDYIFIEPLERTVLDESCPVLRYTINSLSISQYFKFGPPPRLCSVSQRILRKH